MTSTHTAGPVTAGLCAIALVAGCGVSGSAADGPPATEASTTITTTTTTTTTTTEASTTSTTTTEPDGGGDFDDLDLGDVSVTVGSKDFTENQLVAEMFAQAIEAGGGRVDREISLGGTMVNREALLSGDIGLYPEYTGSGWIVHLENEDPSDDAEQLYDATAEADLAQNDIAWLGRSEFNNTYAFATGPTLTEENGGPFDAHAMADYLEATPDATVCMETEFPDRADGLVLFEDATGFTVPADQQTIAEVGDIYTDTADGTCDFGEVFSTDGRIPELELELVDAEGIFVIYNLSMTVSAEVYEQAPDALTTVAETILEDLDNEAMAELNQRVDVEGESIEAVAEGHLVDQGFIE